MNTAKALAGWTLAISMATGACSGDQPPPRAADASTSARVRHEPVVETPKRMDNGQPFRARLGHGAELYVPSWFAPARDGYDLIVHFHGMGKLQESNLETSRINAVVVSVNHGVGTDGYSHAFRDPQSFQKLLDETQEQVTASGRTGRGEQGQSAKIRRIALSAWSAGFVSVSQILRDPTNASMVDAVLLADGFFTSFTDPKKRIINTASLERFVALANAASKSEKLFGITHTAIPTQGYPSVEETVAKLLEMTTSQKTATNVYGPRKMVETYVVDRGSFHVKGYEGITAGDHIKQIHAMGETLWPYLKTRWDGSPPL